MPKKISQEGLVSIIPLLVIVAAVGIISYLLIAYTAPLSGIFNKINPKPKSHAAVSAITTPLKQSTINPNYFVDGNGKAVVLTGSHTWNNLQDWGGNGSIQTMDFNAYVNMLTSHNQNFTLLWRTEFPHFCNLPTAAVQDYDVDSEPWQRTGPGTASDGKPKYDLSKFDQNFFDRLRSRVSQLNNAGIYTGVYFFTGEWLGSFACGNDGDPFDTANNINGISAAGTGQISMSTTNSVTNFQEAYVNKVIDTLNDLPNVLWIVSEESPGGLNWWNAHMIDYTKSYEANKPFQHPVGIASGSDSDMYNSNADWVAPGGRISPTTSCGSGTPRCKVNINDSDHSYFGMWNDSAQTNRNYFWENFTQGNSVIFMDPYLTYYPREGRNNCQNPVNGICSGADNRWENVRSTMGYIRSYADRMNLIAMKPRSDLTSTQNALANTSATGSEFLVYSPNGGTFTVNLANTTRSLNIEWFNPSTGAKTSAGTVNGGSVSQSFTPPFSSDAVLYLVDAGGQGTPPPTQPPTPTPTPTPPPVPGTPYFVQSNTLDTSGSSGTVTFNNNVNAGDLLLAAVRLGNNTASATVTDNNGNTWTRIDRQVDNGTGTGNEVELWFSANAKVTPNAKPTLTVTSSVSATLRVIVEEYGNISANSPLDQHAIASGNSASMNVTTGSTSQANELVVGFGENENGSTITPDPNYTFDTQVATKLATEYRFVQSTGIQTANFGISAQNWAMGVATFKAVGTVSFCQGTDLDGNGKVDIFDYNSLVGNFGKTGTGITGDIDGNGKVDIFDYNALVGNFGKTGC